MRDYTHPANPPAALPPLPHVLIQGGTIDTVLLGCVQGSDTKYDGLADGLIASWATVDVADLVSVRAKRAAVVFASSAGKIVSTTGKGDV
jgi:hypothetical protein